MLIEFSVQNFRSIKEKQTFSMVPSSYNKELADDGNIKPVTKKISLLPTAALYGANSSGKSNLLNAMGRMHNIVVNSVRRNAGDELPYDPFALDENFASAPTEFQATFFMNGKTYRYGFAYDRNEIKNEWLWEKTHIKEYMLFTRNGNKFSLGSRFKEGIGKESMTTANRLFLSLVAQLNGKTSIQILYWFQKFSIISGISNRKYRNYSIKMLLNNDGKATASKRFLSQMDLGFSNLRPQEQDINESIFPANIPETIKESFLKEHANEKMYLVDSVHKVLLRDGTISHQPFDFEKMESDGTIKIFDLSGPIIDTLMNGYTLIIDELDAKLHPLLTKRIVNIFNSEKGNPYNAQLIFATHDTNLLNIDTLRRDQIWFIDKDKKDEASRLNRLSDMMILKKNEDRKVRKDQVFEKDYLVTKLYGALPEIDEDFDLKEAAGI